MDLAMSFMKKTVTRENDFSVKDVIYDVDTKGMNTAVHVRLMRFYQGLRVLGGDSVVHINADDFSLLGITQTVENPIEINSNYIEKMKAKAEERGQELVIFENSGVSVLAWDVIKTGTASDGTPMILHYIIETSTGEELIQYSDTSTFLNTGWPATPLKNEREVKQNTEDFQLLSLKETVSCSSTEAAEGIGYTNYSGMVFLSTSFSGGVYKLKDTTRNCHFTANYCGNPSANVYSPYYLDDDYYNYWWYDCNGTLSETLDDIWGNGTFSNNNTAAADAHYGHAGTFDYFLNNFGRKGIYNNESGIYSRVHAGQYYPNAFWIFGKRIITYGDGDGSVLKPFPALEVAAHEYAHGIIEATAGLLYYGEPGGLNEATSDIFAVLADFYTTDRPLYNPNYLIGDPLFFEPGQFFRSMIQPSDDNVDYYGYTYGSYDCYCIEINWVNVHYSSGVGNHFFYLLAEGTVNGFPSLTCNAGDCQKATGTGTLIGIGKEKAGNIWYRALTLYFTPLTNYFIARLATIQAAKDLYTDVEVQAVDNAWAAVNVYGFKIPTSRPTTRPQGSYSYSYHYPSKSKSKRKSKPGVPKSKSNKSGGPKSKGKGAQHTRHYVK